MLKLSLVMPVFNTAPFLSICIESILNQSFSEYELILVDDGSTDNSLQICMEYAKKDQRIMVKKAPHMGVSATRNLGMDKASGQHLVFVDSDDYLPCDFLMTLFQVKELYGDNCLYMTSIKHYIDKKIIIYQYSDEPISIVQRKNILTLYEKKILQSPTNKLYNLEHIKKNKLKFQEDCDLGEDILFNIDYIEICEKYIIVNGIYYHYIKQNVNSISNVYNKNYYKIHEKIYFYFMERCKNWDIEESEYVILCKWFIAVVLDGMYATMKNKELRFYDRVKENNKLLKSKNILSILGDYKVQIPLVYYMILKYCNYPILYIIQLVYYWWIEFEVDI